MKSTVEKIFLSIFKDGFRNKSYSTDLFITDGDNYCVASIVRLEWQRSFGRHAVGIGYYFSDISEEVMEKPPKYYQCQATLDGRYLDYLNDPRDGADLDLAINDYTEMSDEERRQIIKRYYDNYFTRYINEEISPEGMMRAANVRCLSDLWRRHSLGPVIERYRHLEFPEGIDRPY